jgi:hypothetical protein
MTKPVITSRQTKGIALTYAELDTNFANLRDSTIGITAGTGGTTVTSDLNGSVTLVAGTGITLAGNNTAKTITITGTNSSSLGITGDTGSITNVINGSLKISGGTGLTSSISGSTVTVDMDSTSVTPGTYSTANITVDAQGRITYAANGTSTYVLPAATTYSLGGVKVDGTTITINNDIITANYTNYTLPIASTNTLGGVSIDGTTITINSGGVISVVNTSAPIKVISPANGNTLTTAISQSPVQYRISSGFVPQIAGFNTSATITGWVLQHINLVAVRHEQIASTNLTNNTWTNISTQSMGTNGDAFQFTISGSSGSPTVYFLHRVTYYRISSNSVSIMVEKLY